VTVVNGYTCLIACKHYPMMWDARNDLPTEETFACS